MNTGRWERTKQILEEALRLAPGRRQAHLDSACGPDSELRAEVESLIASHEEAGSQFLVAAAPEVLQLTSSSNPPKIRPDKVIGHYKLMEQIGRGGMGVVYKAEDTKLGRLVALKFLSEPLAGDDSALERFRREARTASALDHPNICTIYEIGEHAGLPFIAMQYLEGQTLDQHISGKPLPVGEVLEMGIQIADALEVAHAVGIIHRDIKPANIFVTRRGQAKVLDFGIAKLSQELRTGASGLSGKPPTTVDAVFTSPGAQVGTFAYMSPEQERGEEVDARSDLFSFGLVLFDMATGWNSFSDRVASVIHAAVGSTTAQRSAPKLPPGLGAIIEKATQVDRNLRYQSAAEMRATLERLRLETSPPQRATESVNAQPQTGPTNHWKWVGSAAVVVLALSVAGYFYFHRTPKLTDKDTIVLADFTNTTGDPVFDTTLKTALTVSLRQSPFLNVLSDDKAAATLRLMARPTTSPLTFDVAREVCQRAGSKAYIGGSIVGLGSQYVLGLKATNCQSGETLAQQQVTAAAKETVLGALGEAASRLRGELGESLATVQKFDVPLAEATTSSLEALKAYSLGEKAHREKGLPFAVPYHQRAVELDPSFAIGYEGLGDDYYTLGEVGRASEYLTKAFRLREHASEREKLAITADYYSNVTGEQDKAAQTYQEAIQTYPREYRLHLDLGNVYVALAQYEKAREAYSQSLRFAPDNAGASSDLVNSLLALQRFDEARQTLQQAEAKKVDVFILHNALYALSFLGADFPAMEEQRRWFTGKPEENFWFSLASDTEAYSGHLRKARELSKQSVRSAIRADSKETGAIWQEIAAQREAAFGNAMNARQVATDGLKLAPTSPGAAAETALALAMAGDAARSESLAQDLNKRFPLDTQMQSVWLPAIQAQSALNRNNPALALNVLKAASPIELGQVPFVANLSCLYPAYVRGEAFLASGQGSAAAAEFQKILDHSGIVWNCWTGALARLGVARANALQSRTSLGADADAARVRAHTAYQDFLALWKDADPDIPILKQAKAEYAKLQ